MQRLPKIVRILAVISFTAVVVLFAALIVNSFQNSGKPLTSLAPEGPSAESIQKLVIPVTAIAGIVFVLVIGAIVFITWKFRERKDSDPDEFPSQIHGQTTLEIGWTILPALILAGIAVGKRGTGVIENGVAGGSNQNSRPLADVDDFGAKRPGWQIIGRRQQQRQPQHRAQCTQWKAARQQ